MINEHFANPSLVMPTILFFVAYIFILNGLNMLGKISNKDVGVWNLLIGGFMSVMLIIGTVYQLWGPNTWINVVGTFLFAFTYLGIGLTNLCGLEGKGLGWYCLLVAIITPFFSQMNFSLGDWRFGIIWLLWGGLWLMFFLILALEKTKLAGRAMATAMILAGVLTLWIPGYTMLRGWW